MAKFKQEKLWRDKMPAAARARGSIVHSHLLDDAEYAQALRKKLIEETQEVVNATDTNELKEEIADVLEVIEALCVHHTLSQDDIQKIKQEKTNLKGGFLKRQFVTAVEDPPNSAGERYCLERPDKYEQID